MQMSCRFPLLVAAFVVAAVSLVFAVSSSSAKGRFLRVVDGQLVPVDPSQSNTGYFLLTYVGDLIEIEEGTGGEFDAIAPLVGGYDKLNLFPDSAEQDGVRVFKQPPWDAPHFRVVNDELVPLDQSEPSTHHFIVTKSGYRIEKGPSWPGPEGLRRRAEIAEVVGWDEIPMPDGISSMGDVLRLLADLEAAAKAARTDAGIPAATALADPAPNPGNPSVTLHYTIGHGEALPVTLHICNTLGQVVRTLVNEVQRTGVYVVVWDGLDNNGKPVAAGTYFGALTAEDFKESKKFTLAK